jgi:hypothetical protein
VEQEEVAIARQRSSKRVSAAMNQHTTIEELLEGVFSVWSAPKLYNEDQREKLVTKNQVIMLKVIPVFNIISLDLVWWKS